MKKLDNKMSRKKIHTCTLFFSRVAAFFFFFRTVAEPPFFFFFHRGISLLYKKFPRFVSPWNNARARAIYFDVRDLDRIVCFGWHFERENRPRMSDRYEFLDAQIALRRFSSRVRGVTAPASGFVSSRLGECRWREDGFFSCYRVLVRFTRCSDKRSLARTVTRRTLAHVLWPKYICRTKRGCTLFILQPLYLRLYFSALLLIEIDRRYSFQSM